MPSNIIYFINLFSREMGFLMGKGVAAFYDFSVQETGSLKSMTKNQVEFTSSLCTIVSNPRFERPVQRSTCLCLATMIPSVTVPETYLYIFLPWRQYSIIPLSIT